MILRKEQMCPLLWTTFSSIVVWLEKSGIAPKVCPILSAVIPLTSIPLSCSTNNFMHLGVPSGTISFWILPFHTVSLITARFPPEYTFMLATLRLSIRRVFPMTWSIIKASDAKKLSIDNVKCMFDLIYKHIIIDVAFFLGYKMPLVCHP